MINNYHLDAQDQSVLFVKITLSAILCRVKRSFKPYQNEHNSVKDIREKGKKPSCSIDLKNTKRKKPIMHVTLTWKFPWKFCSTTFLPFVSSNPKILKAFRKTFPPKMKPAKCEKRKKNWGKLEKRKRGEERTRKVKVKKCSFLRMPELWKLIYGIWIRRPQSVQPVETALW